MSLTAHHRTPPSRSSHPEIRLRACVPRPPTPAVSGQAPLQLKAHFTHLGAHECAKCTWFPCTSKPRCAYGLRQSCAARCRPCSQCDKHLCQLPENPSAKKTLTPHQPSQRPVDARQTHTSPASVRHTLSAHAAYLRVVCAGSSSVRVLACARKIDATMSDVVVTISDVVVTTFCMVVTTFDMVRTT